VDACERQKRVGFEVGVCIKRGVCAYGEMGIDIDRRGVWLGQTHQVADQGASINKEGKADTVWNRSGCVKRATGHTHTHTPTENNTPDTHIHDKNNTPTPKRTPPTNT